MWVKPDQPVSGQCRSVLIFVSPTAQLDISTDGLGRLEWRMQTGRGSQISFSHRPAEAGKEAWSHVAVTCDQGQVGLYLDGTRVDPRDVRWTASTQFLNIGGGSYGSWKGLIDEVVVYSEVLDQERIRRVVSAVKPVDLDPSGQTWSQQQSWQMGEGLGGAAGPGLEARKAMARSTIRQLGTCVEVLAGQWAPNVYAGDWRQANAMRSPLRMLSAQLRAGTGTGDAASQPQGADSLGLLAMPPRSVAQALAVLSDVGGPGNQVRAAVSAMADLVDQIIQAVESRDGVAVQSGSSDLRKAYLRLLTTLGLDGDVTFQVQPGTPSRASPRMPATRVRPRPVRTR
jgi:hypothetical protein